MITPSPRSNNKTKKKIISSDQKQNSAKSIFKTMTNEDKSDGHNINKNINSYPKNITHSEKAKSTKKQILSKCV
jgi:hypothetical protein